MITEVNFRQETCNGWIRRSVILSRPNRDDQVLWMEVPETYTSWLTLNEEPLLLLALFFIMEQGGECRIHADIDRTLLEHLTEHLRIWHLWLPDTFHCPELIPDAIVERRTTADRKEAICAFSGGVDAAFTLMSHISGYWGNLSLKVPAAIMIHGADIFLNQQESFDCAFTQAKAAVSAYGVELIPVRTNHRYTPSDWKLTHYSVVAAALSLFGNRFCRGLIGSDSIASKLGIIMRLPYAMNYVTDYLLNSATFDCNIVGSDVTRSQRCAHIAQYPSILKYLRVCWQHDSGGCNCGVCEKCQRTLLNFMVTGYKGNLPFGQPFSLQRFRETPYVGCIIQSALEEILEHNKTTHALPEVVVEAIEEKLAQDWSGSREKLLDPNCPVYPWGCTGDIPPTPLPTSPNEPPPELQSVPCLPEELLTMQPLHKVEEEALLPPVDEPSPPPTGSPIMLRLLMLRYRLMGHLTWGNRRKKYKQKRRDCREQLLLFKRHKG